MNTNIKIDLEKLENSFKEFMIIMWLDLDKPSLKDTPKRVSKMFVNEICKWLFELPPVITTFPNDWNYTWMVVVKDIKVQSLCEHHFQPFIWTCDIAYIPKDKVVWLSKFARVVDYFSRRPQIQERLTQQIFEFWKKELGTDDIIIRINAEHFCMKLRGIKDTWSNTITCIADWVFMEQWIARSDFFDHLKI